MADPARRFATYDDLLAVPENQIAELIHGTLVTQPRPAAPHALVSSAMGIDVGAPFHFGRGGPGGWVILDEPELHLGADVLVPDLAGWRRDRMPEVPRTAAFTLAPDWICEVLSPATAARDRGEKLAIYAREGVRFAWLVDPDPKTLEVFRLVEGKWLLEAVYSGDAVVRAIPFDAVEIALAGWWA